ALGGGPYHFFDRSSFSAAASSIWSASSFFSFAFSSSKAFRRLASDTSIPSYFAFQLYSVTSLTPCLRARSPAFAPASCSRSTAMICSSVNRFRFIRPSFIRGRTLTPGGGKTQWQVKPYSVFRRGRKRVAKEGASTQDHRASLLISLRENRILRSAATRRRFDSTSLTSYGSRQVR